MTHAHDPSEPTIRCRRVDARYSVAEHKDCPYCYGKASDVATGDHTKFCDFKPGQDPVCFGFPDREVDAAPPTSTKHRKPSSCANRPTCIGSSKIGWPKC